MRTYVLSVEGRIINTRQRVGELLRLGLSQQAIANALGISKSTAAYHARRLGRPADDRFNRRYDWEQVQRFHDAGASMRDCVRHFGFSHETWRSAIERGALRSRPRGMPIEELVDGRRNRSHLKRRLIRAGLLTDGCARCGISDWRGARLSLELHHVNGREGDNRLENLQLLCPNCHSQTDSWGGRNRRRKQGQASG